MGILYVATAVALVVLCFTSPMRRLAHASHVKPILNKIANRFIAMGGVYGEDGKRFSLEGRELYKADGTSMEDSNIPAGSTCVASPLTVEARTTLKAGDIVVVDAPTEKSPTGLRLRKVVNIRSDGLVEFKNHRPRPLEQVHARVTHVLAA